ncbi:MAG: hypothetical protein ABIM60_05905 [candidate division WOR-3 bacterium]
MILVIIAGILFLNNLNSQEKKAVIPPKKWVRRVIRQPDNPPPYKNYSPGEIAIGDARNDGVQRLYCANLNKDVVEYSWENGNWVPRVIAPNIDLTGMVIGKARANDNLNRIYTYRSKGDRKLYEISYENGSWVIREIQLPSQISHPIHGILTGDGRNDGINRLYLGTFNWKSYELRYNGENWVLESVVSEHIKIGALGPGRNDGINRFYGISGDSLFEITYSNGGWQETLIGVWPNPEGLEPVGQFARPHLFHMGVTGPMIIIKHGLDRIFYSYKYNASTHSWEVTQMIPSFSLRYLYGMSYGFFQPYDVMQDPRSLLFKKNLYVGAIPEDIPHGDTIYIHEFSYNPSNNTWTRNTISYITVAPVAVVCLKCGNIRGKNCIYAIAEDGTIVEISYE